MARYYKENGEEVAGLRDARKINGKPSVTTIINACAPHEYKYLDDKRLREALESEGSYEEKLELLGNKPVFEAGTLVHEGAELFHELGTRSSLLECPVSSEQLYNTIMSWDIRSVERFLYSKTIGTGGRLDIIALKKELAGVVDIKTVMTLKKKPSKTWLLQLGAYYALCVENDIPIKWAAILQFSKKDEGCVTLEVSEDELKEAANFFSDLRRVFGYMYGI